MRSGLSEAQKNKLSVLSKLTSDVQNEVWDAYETGLMSDAKSAVYDLKERVTSDELMPAEVKAGLLRIVEDAWGLMVGGGTTHDRAQRSHAKLAEAERYLQQVLQGIA